MESLSLSLFVFSSTAPLTFVRNAREPSGLDDVRGPVEAGRHDAVPVLVYRRAVSELELVRNDCPAQSHSGETGVLGEAASLDAALVRARNLVDALGRAVLDVDGVGRVVDDDGSVLLGKVDQGLELVVRSARPGGVVGVAEEDEVRLGGLRDVGEEAVLLEAVHVLDVLVLARLLVEKAGGAHDDARVHVGGVGGVLDRDGGVRAEEHEYSRDVALAPVGDEDLAARDPQAVVEPVRELLSQRAHALLRAVPGVPLLGVEPRGGALEGVGDDLRDGLGGVSDSEGDDLRVRVLLLVVSASPPDFGEEVAGPQLCQVGIAVHSRRGLGGHGGEPRPAPRAAARAHHSGLHHHCSLFFASSSSSLGSILPPLHLSLSYLSKKKMRPPFPGVS